MTDHNKSDDAASPTTKVKKPYRAPALIEWGTLRDITQTAGKTSPHADGGSGKQNKQTS